MNVPFLDLSRETAQIRDELDEAIGRVLDAGQFVLGPIVEEFEAAFAEYCGVSHAIGVASGTDAITIALQAAGIGAGDEVITAANTCIPTVAAIEAAGASVVLADVDSRSYTLDPDRLGELLTERTRAVVPVHLYGQCADMPRIVEFARQHHLRVIEDAAQAHGAAFGPKRAGSLGDAGAFSFYPTKNLGALGDGGAVVTNDRELAQQTRLLRSYGERDRYESIRTGWNSRLDPVQAAVLSVKLSFLEAWTDRRREIAAFYRQSLADLNIGLPAELEGRRHVYHLFVVTVADRHAFRCSLDDAGIGTLVHYPRPVHFHPAYARLVKPGDRLAMSERLSAEVVSLPLFPTLQQHELEAVVAGVREATRASTSRLDPA